MVAKADSWDNQLATIDTATGINQIIGFHHRQAMLPQMLQLSNTTNAALSSSAGDQFSSRVVK
jgi:hypothetical protein